MDKEQVLYTNTHTPTPARARTHTHTMEDYSAINRNEIL